MISFYDKPPRGSANRRIVTVPEGWTTKSEVFQFYAKELEFPDYFGNNWDAFSECVNDFVFRPPLQIHFIHTDIPLVNNRKEASIYLDILFMCFETESGSCLIGHFPDILVNEIKDLLFETKN